MRRMLVLPAIFMVILLTWCSVAAIYASAARQGMLAAHTAPTPLAASERSATVPPALQQDVVARGGAHTHEIALTFDDGPYPYYTAQILTILQRYQVHATFFCVGRNVQNYPMLVQQEYAAGNSIGNHTWNHADLTRVSRWRVQREITSANAIIQSTIGVAPTLLRPPYGAINASVRSQIVQLNLVPVMWSVDTRDWQLPGVDAITNVALTQARDGGIILLHDGGGNRLQTVMALPQIIAGLQLRGYKFVTVPQLISDRPGKV